MNDAHAKAKELLADSLGLPADALADDAAVDTVAAWDSLAHMRVILAVEARLGVELPPEAILTISSLHDLAALLGNGDDGAG